MTESHDSLDLPSAGEVAELPKDGGPRFNRLIFETSPYLLQHARNPVNWYPWGEEAFEKARREDKPVLVSIGYSTCHWCHVMERESFEDDEVADVLNQYVVPVKVDREQRPDLDNLYMTAAQIMTGSGGWPLNVMLTPEGKPFFAATYVPARPAYGRPGMTALIPQLASLYKADDPRIAITIEQLEPIMRQQLAGPADLGPAEPDLAHVRAAVGHFLREADRSMGGAAGAPKFPPHGPLRLILETHDRLGLPEAVDAACITLDAMARGGIRDHVGGGFHRYSTDARWHVPHFEKMLYDNAQLLIAYALGWQLTGKALYREAAEGIVAWIEREMTHPEGGFYSALDADSEGEEGLFYTWSWDELEAALAPDELTLAARVYGLSPEGNYRDEAGGYDTGRNILALQGSLEELARNAELGVEALSDRLDVILGKLLSARSRRVRPHLDDKVLAAWNGMAVAALARAGKIFDRPRWIDAAEKAAAFVLEKLADDAGNLARSHRRGATSGRAFLDDYACLADGLLALQAATADTRHLDEAARLMQTVLDHFADGSGAFYLTDDRHEKLIVRSRDLFDSAVPSGNGVAAGVLVDLAVRTGESRWTEAARTLLKRTVPLVTHVPSASYSVALAEAAWLCAAPWRQPGTGTVLAEADDGTARLFVEGSPPRVRPNEPIHLSVGLEVAGQLHVNAHRPGVDGLLGATLTVDEPFDLVEITYPQGKPLGGPGQGRPTVYAGTVHLAATVRAPRGPAAAAGPIVLHLDFQPCTGASCLDRRRLDLKVPTSSADT